MNGTNVEEVAQVRLGHLRTLHGRGVRTRQVGSVLDVPGGPDLTAAACKGLPGFTELPTAKAKAICVGCPVRDLCLDRALARREGHGVWGALSARDRSVLTSGMS